MFFTQEDYRKIYDWIKIHSIKDSEFNDSKPLDGMETITVVQQGHNVKFILQDFLEQLTLLNIPDFVNVTERYNLKYISLFEATKAIPYKSRKIGQVVTFLDEDGNWKIYQFRGEKKNQWNILTLWVDILGEIIDKGSIIPDEEDLTAIKEGDKTVVKFKDKAYNPDNFSGKGRVYLRKNIVEVIDYNTKVKTTKNLLTQSMIGWEDTIYIIQYDYDLNGQTITIPKGCVLQFEGGSFKNGTVNGNNSTINAPFYCIFENLHLSGTFSTTGFYIEWFGAKGDGISDDTDAIQYAIDEVDSLRNIPNGELGEFHGTTRPFNIQMHINKQKEVKSIILQSKKYIVSKTLTIRNSSIIGNNGGFLSKINNGGYIIQTPEMIEGDVYTEWYGGSIKNLYLEAYSTEYNCGGISINSAVNVVIDGLKTVNLTQTALHLTGYEIMVSNYMIRGVTGNSNNTTGIHIIGGDNMILNGAIVGYNIGVCVESSDTILNNIHVWDSCRICFFINKAGQCSCINLICDSYTPINNTLLPEDEVSEGVLNGGAGILVCSSQVSIVNCTDFNGGTPYFIRFYNSGKAFSTFISGIMTTKSDRTNLISCDDNTELLGFPNLHSLDITHLDIGLANWNNTPVINIKTPYYDTAATRLGVNFRMYDGEGSRGDIYPLKLTVELSKDREISKVTEEISDVSITKEVHDGIINIYHNGYDDKGLVLGQHLTSPGYSYKNYINKEYVNYIVLNPSSSIDESDSGRNILFSTGGKLRFRDASDNIRGSNGALLTSDTPYVDSFGYYGGNIVDNGDLYYYTDSNGYNHLLILKDKTFYTVDDELWNTPKECHSEQLPSNTVYRHLGARVFLTDKKINIYKGENGFIEYDGVAYGSIRCGTTSQRNTAASNNKYPGFQYFDTTLNKPTWWNGTEWVDAEGNNANSIPITSGTFSNKPTGVDVGYAYFCTDKQTAEGSTNGIMIYYKGNNVWVDALGRVVS